MITRVLFDSLCIILEMIFSANHMTSVNTLYSQQIAWLVVLLD